VHRGHQLQELGDQCPCRCLGHANEAAAVHTESPHESATLLHAGMSYGPPRTLHCRDRLEPWEQGRTVCLPLARESQESLMRCDLRQVLLLKLELRGPGRW